MNATQAAYWINAGYNDCHEKGFSCPDIARYSAEEMVLADAGFRLANLGFPKIEMPDE